MTDAAIALLPERRRRIPMNLRATLILAVAANLAFTAAALHLLPARLASHFGPGGAPNGWMPAGAYAVTMGALNVLVFLLMLAAPRLTTALPARWVNLPHKDYWLDPARRAQTRALLEPFLWSLGIALLSLFLVMNALVVEANRAEPVRLNERWFLAALGAFLAFTLGWTIRFHRAFRRPPDPRTAPHPTPT